MNYGRYYCYSVILPDKSIFSCGGRVGTAEMNMGVSGTAPAAGTDLPHDPMAILDTEVFDPKKGTWTKMAPMSVDRVYHSNAILLPDGRVMTCGSNPARRMNELRIEIYRPPYLYKGNRPSLVKVPHSISYGSSFEIELDSMSEIENITLIRPAATTHSVNAEQRYLGLVFQSSSSTKATATVPGNKNFAPPGYYMLFAVSADGVPSVGKFVLLR